MVVIMNTETSGGVYTLYTLYTLYRYNYEQNEYSKYCYICNQYLGNTIGYGIFYKGDYRNMNNKSTPPLWLRCPKSKEFLIICGQDICFNMVLIDVNTYKPLF